MTVLWRSGQASPVDADEDIFGMLRRSMRSRLVGGGAEEEGSALVVEASPELQALKTSPHAASAHHFPLPLNPEFLRCSSQGPAWANGIDPRCHASEGEREAHSTAPSRE